MKKHVQDNHGNLYSSKTEDIIKKKKDSVHQSQREKKFIERTLERAYEDWIRKVCIERYFDMPPQEEETEEVKDVPFVRFSGKKRDRVEPAIDQNLN